MTDQAAPSDFTVLPDLAAERSGGAVISANDEFFADKENLLKAAAPVWREGVYTDRGKWMDGWETRRRREPGSDWCIIRLGEPGVIRGVVVDTAHFTGNYPEACSIEAASLPGVPDAAALASARWVEILPRSPLAGDCRNPFAIASTARWTHLRFSIHPDGGVARLRVHGDAVPDADLLRRVAGWTDLAALSNGGQVVAQSDAFYGTAANMLKGGRSVDMSDGWETKRRRAPGNEWAIVRLSQPGLVRRAEIDTDHFKGNAPGWCSLESCVAQHDDLSAAAWQPLLPRTPLQPHARHGFESELATRDAVTHVRLSIYPDGGIARLRLLGTACRT
ncbi:MAG: allantoicase [Gemmatimonadaceae bacterium]